MERGKLHQYGSYKEYLDRQKEKTTDPKRREKWLGSEWNIKLKGFERIFESHKKILGGRRRALALGARTGQEVVALRNLGIDAIGLDLVPHEPLVIEGDFHNIPFPNNYFDFVFTNCFDHSLHPEKFVSEMERVAKPGSLLMMHLQLGINSDAYTETPITNIAELIILFRNSKVFAATEIRKNFANMNYEIIFQKNLPLQEEEKSLSIAISTYNRKKILKELLKTLESQTDKNFEVIVVIDGSTDGTEEMLAEYKKTSPLELRWLNTGLTDTYGLAKARNMGIKEARGEAVVILDDDSFPVPEFVAEHKKTVQPKTLTGGARLSTNPSDDLADKMKAYLETYGDSIPSKFRPVRTYKYVVENNTCMYKQDWIDSGLFNESIIEYGGIGQDFNHQLIRHGFKYQFNPRAAITHHIEYRQNQTYPRVKTKTIVTDFKNFFRKTLPSIYNLTKKIKQLWEYHSIR